MNLVNAIATLAANPSHAMSCDDGRVVGFNRKGTLINYAGGPNAPCILKLRDFMREDWDVLSPDELARRGAELDELQRQAAAAEAAQSK